MSHTFKKRTEDFVCGHCGTETAGSGYTNHCPVCLWSRHVDIHPGDRAAECGGLMEPVGVMQKHGEYRIQHRCVVCGHETVMTAAKDDRVETLIALSSKNV